MMSVTVLCRTCKYVACTDPSTAAVTTTGVSTDDREINAACIFKESSRLECGRVEWSGVVSVGEISCVTVYNSLESYKSSKSKDLVTHSQRTLRIITMTLNRLQRRLRDRSQRPWTLPSVTHRMIHSDLAAGQRRL
jgi:hypothetical protein